MDCHTNEDNANTFLVTAFKHVITQVYHTSGNEIGRGGFRTLTPIEVYNTIQAWYGVPGAQEEEDTLGRLDIPMNQDYPPEVMMIHLEQEKLIFLVHLEGGRVMTDVQMTHLAVKRLRACLSLYGRALSVWHGKDAEFRRHCAKFCTTIEKQYVEMFAQRGDKTLADDGYTSETLQCPLNCSYLKGHYVPRSQTRFCILDAPSSGVHVREHRTYYVHTMGHSDYIPSGILSTYDRAYFFV